MKSHFTTALIFLILLGTEIHATIKTVDNRPNSASQYINLQTAIDSATAGDTIYVSGSNITYGAISLNKKLVLFGAGYNPSKDFALPTTIRGIILDSVPGISGPSGSSIYGFNVTDPSLGYFEIGNLLTSVSDLVISRNHFDGTFYFNYGNSAPATNVLITDNLFSTCGSCPMYVAQISGLIFQNNIVEVSSWIPGVSFLNSQSALINNNLFIGTSVNLGDIDFCILSNNIFYGCYPNATNSTFDNNLIYDTGNDLLPYGSNIGANNFNGQAPLFVNVPSQVLDFSFDYHLQVISPGHNGGTDGSDIGCFGGIKPLNDLTGMPPIPQMIQMNIGNPIITPNSNINISFKAKNNN